MPLSALLIWRPHWVLHAMDINLFFIVLCAFFCASRLGNIRLSGSNTSKLPEYSPIKWFGLIVAIECFAALFFANLLQTSFYYLAHTHFASEFVLPNPEVMLNHLLVEWGLFPWSLYALLACIFAYLHFHDGEPALLSALLPPLKSTYHDRFIRRGINTFMSAVSNGALTIMLVIITLQITIFMLHILGLDNTQYIKAGGTLVYILAAMLVITPALDYYVRHIGRRFRRTWIYLAPYILLTTLFIMLSTFLGQYIFDYIEQTLAYSNFTMYFPIQPNIRLINADWTLLYWAWWVLSAWLFSSMIARVSRGKRIKDIILGTLTAPCIIAYLLVIKGVYPQSLMANWIGNMGHWILWIGNNHVVSLIGPLIILSFFMTLKDSRYAIFGFMPYEKSYVTARPIKPEQFVHPLLQFTTLFIAGFLVMNMRSIQYLSALGAIPAMLFFIVSCLWFYRRLFMRQKT